MRLWKHSSVETAKQGKETAINNANKYRNITPGKAEVDKIFNKAESTKAKRLTKQRQHCRFNEMYKEYKKYPLVTKERMFCKTMEDILPSLKVIIDNGGNINKFCPRPIMEGGSANE